VLLIEQSAEISIWLRGIVFLKKLVSFEVSEWLGYESGASA